MVLARKPGRVGDGSWNHTMRPGQGACRTQSAGAPQGADLRTGGRAGLWEADVGRRRLKWGRVAQGLAASRFSDLRLLCSPPPLLSHLCFLLYSFTQGALSCVLNLEVSEIKTALLAQKK